MKKHLRILYGCDDRFELTINTINVSKQYFDTCGIINVGPVEFKDKLQQAVGIDVKVDQFYQFFELESARRAQLRDIPFDDWVMWIDADETPSPSLLRDLNKTTEFCELNNYDCVRLCYAHHQDGIYNPTPIPQNNEEFMKCPGLFVGARYIKKKKNIELMTNFGAHELFRNVDDRWVYMPYFINHMKSHIQYYQSITLSGFMNPYVHVNNNLSIGDLIKTPEYQNLKLFKKKWNVITSNDLVKKLKIEKNIQFKEELRVLFMSFPALYSKESERYNNNVLTAFTYMREFAEKYDLNVESPIYKCGKECCKYDNIQL